MISLLIKLWWKNITKSLVTPLQRLLYGDNLPYKINVDDRGLILQKYNSPKPHYYKSAITRLKYRNKFLDKTNY